MAMKRKRVYSIATCVLCLVGVGMYFARQNALEQVRANERLRTENWISDTIKALESGQSSLFLYSCKNTDILLQEIAGMPEVGSITFEQTHDLSDVGIAVLQSFGNLEKLEFRSEPGLTDKNIHLLAECKSLRSLAIKRSDVTDAGLDAIADLPALEMLRHTGQFSKSALLQLSESLPHIAIVESGW